MRPLEPLAPGRGPKPARREALASGHGEPQAGHGGCGEDGAEHDRHSPARTPEGQGSAACERQPPGHAEHSPGQVCFSHQKGGSNQHESHTELHHLALPQWYASASACV